MVYFAALLPHDDQKCYDVVFPDLPGCVSQGDNLEEALEMALESLELHLEGLVADKEPLPKASSLEQAKVKLAELGSAPMPEHIIFQAIPVKIKSEEPPVRLTISLKPALVQGIDLVAKELSLTRSAVLALAARDYIRKMEV